MERQVDLALIRPYWLANALRVGYLVVFDAPNQYGVEGTDCEEVWIVTEESAILVIVPPYWRNIRILPS